MQFGEVARRRAFQLLDNMHGGKQQKLKEVTKFELVNGVTEEYRRRRMGAILEYAHSNCPFYQDLEFCNCLDDFPVQTKSDFIGHYDGILSGEFYGRENELTMLTTSGSTGTPFTVPADPDKMNHVNMNFMAVMELNGFRLGMKRGEFRAWIKGKNTISRFRSIKNNLLMIDISNMSDEHVGRIFDRIRRERIQVLVMYSSALSALVSYAERRHRDFRNTDVEMIFTMGEALPEGVRRKSREIFGINPVLSYGNNENGFIAVSLPGEDDYTIDLYHYYVEKFTEIYGRRGSMLYNTKGEPLSIHVFMNNLLRFEGVLRQAKCIQTDLKAYTLELNPEPGAKVDEDAVVASYRAYLGRDAEIAVRYIGTIPIQQSGKTMVCEQRCGAYQQ